MTFRYGTTTVEFTIDEVRIILVDYVRKQTLASDLNGACLLVDGTDALSTHESIEIVFRPKEGV